MTTLGQMASSQPPVIDGPDTALKLLGVDWSDAVSAIGTAAAVVVSLLLALSSWLKSKKADTRLRATEEKLELDRQRREANLVSAWIEDHYLPSHDGTHYIRQLSAHLANEGNLPVHNVAVGFTCPNTGAESRVRMGPLSVPPVVPTLAPRTHRTWDLTLALLAWSDEHFSYIDDIRTDVHFSDSYGSRWHRGSDGVLCSDDTADSPLFTELSTEDGMQQLGRNISVANPTSIGITFVAALRDAVATGDVSEVLEFLAPIPAWSDIDQEQCSKILGRIGGLGFASHVHYPAPQVAYLRFVDEQSIAKRSHKAELVEIAGEVMTLIFLPDLGWRIFTIGNATSPDAIEFPAGSLGNDWKQTRP
ncbi:hypothetical protein [Arthrobacter sp. NPDC090010]|uniref:hypothetical protein n=1 Tax=Arthrobacter sp. NPDC090010 TaxID=3363942 RepID=UPI00382D9011